MDEVIPDAAVEAAAGAAFQFMEDQPWEAASPEETDFFRDAARRGLEAATPHLLSHEREETRLAHLDAVVNAQTVDRLEREMREAIAEAWDAGEDAGQRNADSARGHDIEHTPNPYRTTK